MKRPAPEETAALAAPDALGRAVDRASGGAGGVRLRRRQLLQARHALHHPATDRHRRHPGLRADHRRADGGHRPQRRRHCGLLLGADGADVLPLWHSRRTGHRHRPGAWHRHGGAERLPDRAAEPAALHRHPGHLADPSGLQLHLLGQRDHRSSDVQEQAPALGFWGKDVTFFGVPTRQTARNPIWPPPTRSLPPPTRWRAPG